VSRRILLGLLVAVPVLAVAWTGWSIWQTRSDLEAGRTAASRLRSAFEAGDERAADDALADLQAAAADARDRTDGLTWSALALAPAVGDDAEAVRTLAASADRLATEGLPGLVDAAGVLDGSGLAPHNGRVDLAGITRLRSPVATADEVFAAVRDDLATVSPTGLVGALRGPFVEVVDDVTRASRALDSADRAVGVLPSMLGESRAHTWLLVFQNNAEVRATGGLPGAVAVVRTKHGRVTQVGERAGNSLGESPRPVLPLTVFERKFYGPQLGTYFLDANFTPDFPRAAALWRARWQQATGEHVDGVIAVDPVALSYLLESTGPIDVPGGRLTADNAVQTLLHDVYLRYPDPADQDAFFAVVASRVFTAITDGAGSPRALMTALARAVGEHRLLVHSFDAAEQERIAGTRVAGELWREKADQPRIDIALNDATGAKMQYFLRYHVDVEATCDDGRQQYAATAVLESTAPKDARKLPDYVTGGDVFGTEPGSQLFVFDIYAPRNGELGRVSADRTPLDYITATHAGRRAASVPILLTPGQTTTVTWTMSAAPGQGGSTSVNVTPGVARESESLLVEEACRN
jgi:hypothetical protein